MRKNGDKIFLLFNGGLQPRALCLELVRELVLANGRQQQRFVHRRRPLAKQRGLGGVGHLDHDAHGTLVAEPFTAKDRPPSVRPVDGKHVAVLLLREALRLPRVVDAIEQRHAAVRYPLGHGLGERTTDQVVAVDPGEAQESGVGVTHNARLALHGEHRLRGKLGKIAGEVHKIERGVRDG